MDLLNEELAPSALLLALAVMQLEDAYPAIERREPADTLRDDGRVMRLDYVYLVDGKGKAMMVNPWQVVRLYAIAIDGEAGGSQIVFPDGKHHDFPIDVDMPCAGLRRAVGEDI